VRMLKNDFYTQVRQAEDRGATEAELQTLLGRTRSKKGMFEGDLENGELEIGQVSALIHEILPAARILSDIWEEYLEARRHLCSSDRIL
jgi:enoyl-[acyl-carrier protein] reductase II